LFGILDAPTAAPLPKGDAMAFAPAPDTPQEKEGEKILVQYLQVSKRSILRGVTMMAHFAGRMPKLQRSATLDAKRHISKDGSLQYSPTDRQGDASVQKELIIRFINGEMESAGKDNAKVAINNENYKFKYKGTRDMDGRTAHVFELNPRKKREGLFKGELWLDGETGLSVRETGRFVKSPSVFLKRVEFVREYTIRDGVAVPKAMQSSIQTRFWGMAELDVQYSDVVWEDPRFLAN
jgi:hypothetical protein